MPTAPTEKTARITALPLEDLARLLAGVYAGKVTVEHVRQVAEEADILRPDGTVNLLEYVAFIIQEMGHGRD
jgi:hypothetical protein